MNKPPHTNLTVTSDRRIPVALLLFRLSIFIVMFMWTLTIGALEIALLVAFIHGIAKRWTYGTVLGLHGISTLSAFKHYAAPFEGPGFFGN